MHKLRKSANAEDVRTDHSAHHPEKKKKISKDKGDYVDFEEIE
jgi:hypothetical protein